MTQATIVKVKYDYRESTFSPIGHINAIVRYGVSKFADKSDYRSSQLRDVIKMEDMGFHQIRKYVLESADNAAAAKKTLEKILVYRQSAAGDLEKPKKLINPYDTGYIDTLSKSLECSPLYKVVPFVGIKKPNSKDFLTKNTEISTISGVSMQIKSVNINSVVNQRTTDGTIPLFDGTIQVDFFMPILKNKKKNILKEITSNFDTLGYIFQMDKQYVLQLKNLSKPQKFANSKHKAAYDALCKQELSLSIITHRYEQTDFKPYENRVSFTFYFHQAPPVSGAASGDKEKSGGVPTKQPEVSSVAEAVNKNNNYSISQEIMEQLYKNGSVLDYQFAIAKENTFDTDEIFYGVRVSTPPSNAETVVDEFAGLDGPILSTGSFFLFRSLLIAIINSFYIKTTTLDKKLFKDILIDEKQYKKLVIYINENKVPSEVGTFYSKSGDIRDTFETMCVDTSVFIKFINDFGSVASTCTLRSVLEAVFNKLIPRMLNSYITTASPGFQYVQAFNKDDFVFKMSPQNNNNQVAAGFKVQEREIAPIPSRSGALTSIYRAGSGYGSRRYDSVPSSTIKKFGKTRMRQVTTASLISGILNSAGVKNTKNAIIIDNKDTDASQVVETRAELEKARKKKNKELRRLSIIPVDYYQKSNPTNNINFRFLTSQGNLPIKFAQLDNTNLADRRRRQAGQTPFFRNIYQVSFQLADIISVVPNHVLFYFKPDLFGFGNHREDSFGFAGVYVVTKVSINYLEDKARFETSVEAKYERTDPDGKFKILPNPSEKESRKKTLSKAERELQEAQTLISAEQGKLERYGRTKKAIAERGQQYILFGTHGKMAQWIGGKKDPEGAIKDIEKKEEASRQNIHRYQKQITDIRKRLKSQGAL